MAAEPPNRAPVQLYRGAVSHYRWNPKKHGFVYEVCMFLIDIDRLNEVFAGWWPFAACNKLGIATFREDDHFKAARKPGQSLSDAVRDLVYARTGSRPTGIIQLLTNLSYAGYCFNPVAFYYIHDSDNQQVETVVAEVTNTPWQEQHYYVLNSRCADVKTFQWKNSQWVAASEYNIGDSKDKVLSAGAEVVDAQAHVPVVCETSEAAAVLASAGAVTPTNFDALTRPFETNSAPTGATTHGVLAVPPQKLRFQFDKTFHVSPFMSMDQTYDWIFTQPSETVLVQNQNVRQDTRMFSSQLRMTRQPLDFWAMLFVIFIAFPLLTFRIQLWIHYEAFRLWRKGVEIHDHPHGSTSGFTRLVSACFAPIVWIVAFIRLVFRKSDKNKNI